jgi:hypothetical protein
MSDNVLSDKGIDLSRLRRRPVNLKTVKKPRFLFPGWKMHHFAMDQVNTTGEENWNSIKTAKSISLPYQGKGHGLEVRQGRSRDGSNVWLLSSYVLVDEQHIVHYGYDVTFEELVRNAEAYILQARDQGQRIFNVDAGSRWEWELNVDKLIAGWKGVPLPA